MPGPIDPSARRPRAQATAPDTAVTPPAQAPRGARARGPMDTLEVGARPRQAAPGGVTAAGLNPAVTPERQRATFESVFRLGRELVRKGQIPVIVVDHRLTAIDDRPITRKGFERLVRSRGVTELQDLDAAMASGVLKFLPGYTEQASDHWRQEHPALVAKYPNAFGSPGSRMDIGFMGFSVRESNATEGLADLLARWKLETDGRGELIFAGAGTGTAADFASVYSRPVAQGGGGIENPDVRFGAPSVSPEADARAQAKVRAYNAAHPNEPAVELDHDSRGKAGWVETIEREQGPNGARKVVAAFIDDRAHNRIASQAAGSLGDRMVSIKAAAPGLSFSQLDNGTENLISTFKPNP